MSLQHESKPRLNIFYNRNNILHVHIDCELQNRDDDILLVFIDRNTSKEIPFPLKKNGQSGTVTSVEAEIDLTKYRDFFHAGTTWDAYLAIGAEEPLRVKSNADIELELLYDFDEEKDRMLVPYTTNKGNLSFKMKERDVLSKIEKIQLDDSGMLYVSGYAFYPGWEEDVSKEVIMRTSDEEDGRAIPAEYSMRMDVIRNEERRGERPKHIGFWAELDLSRVNLSGKEAASFRLYMKINGREESVVQGESVGTDGRLHETTVISSGSGKKKVTVRSTKKNRKLVIRLEKYSLRKEMRNKIIGFATRVKQHPLTKEAYKLAFKTIGLMPRRKKLVMFESFLGKQFSCNPRAIYEYMRKNHPDYELVWSVDKRYTRPFEEQGIAYAKRFSVKWLFLMAGAQYWVSNSRMPLWIPKPRRTVYLQTWHGTPLKRLAADMEEVHMPGTTTEKYKGNFLTESANWDYLISPNAYSTEIFRRAFQFDREMIESGYPRNDYLHQENNTETMERVKEQLGIPADKRVILYAPTWRDDQFYGRGRYKFELDLDLNRLREALGDRYVILLRMHYLVSENFDLGPHEGFAYDFSSHEDIRDLYLVSDLLITDYSSVFFDYANLKRPMIFYVYDIENYRDKLRGFYFDFEKHAPGPLVKTTEAVIEEIVELEARDYAVPESFDPFYDKFCHLEDGQATSRVVNTVFPGRTSK